MMNRQQQILAGVLVAQLVFIAVAFWPRAAATGAGAPVFPGLEAGDMVALTMTDADGNSIALRKEGEGWILPEADGFPAQSEKISPVLDKITGLTTSRLVTRTTASHKRLQVSSEEFVRRLDFQTADGSQHTLYLGSSPQSGVMHFRVDGQQETYLTGDFSTWEMRAEAAAWIDTAYVNLDDAEIDKMTLENANGSFTFTRDEDDNWNMQGLGPDETLDQTAVDGVVQKAASLVMERPLGKEDRPDYGMDRPNAVVHLETADTTITIRLGALDPEDESYVVISSESPYYVRVASYSLQDLVEKTRDGFLQLPPTPTPQEEPGSTE
ncbi:MAG TPA: DUF4340 domain-containing protein [Anaerolineae bacterium]|nr:DUF4340 domain-containing protein [Anaerolineae bacterium]